MLSTNDFNWDFRNKRYQASLSDLHIDAVSPFTLRSEATGEEITMTLASTIRNNSGKVMFWRFEAESKVLRRLFTVRIYNA